MGEIQSRIAASHLFSGHRYAACAGLNTSRGYKEGAATQLMNEGNRIAAIYLSLIKADWLLKPHCGVPSVFRSPLRGLCGVEHITGLQRGRCHAAKE